MREHAARAAAMWSFARRRGSAGVRIGNGDKKGVVMKKSIYQALVILLFGVCLITISFHEVKNEENVAKEALVRDVLIIETETGRERKLRAERDGEAICECWEILQEMPQDTASRNVEYTVTFFLDNGKGVPCSVPKEDTLRTEFLKGFFDHMLRPL